MIRACAYIALRRLKQDYTILHPLLGESGIGIRLSSFHASLEHALGSPSKSAALLLIPRSSNAKERAQELYCVDALTCPTLILLLSELCQTWQRTHELLE